VRPPACAARRRPPQRFAPRQRARPATFALSSRWSRSGSRRRSRSRSRCSSSSSATRSSTPAAAARAAAPPTSVGRACAGSASPQCTQIGRKACWRYDVHVGGGGAAPCDIAARWRDAAPATCLCGRSWPLPGRCLCPCSDAAAVLQLVLLVRVAVLLVVCRSNGAVLYSSVLLRLRQGSRDGRSSSDRSRQNISKDRRTPPGRNVAPGD